MSVLDAIGKFGAVTATEVTELEGSELLRAFEEARGCNSLLEILHTPMEKIATDNVAILRAEIIRRLDIAALQINLFSNQPPQKKLREVMPADYVVVEKYIGGVPGPDYEWIRNAVAAELGLTAQQVGAIRRRIVSSNQLAG